MTHSSGPEDDAQERGGRRRSEPALAAFDDALRALAPTQRRALRLLLTGARLALVAGATGEDRRSLVSWIGAEHTFVAALQSLQRDLDVTDRATLRALVAAELRWENDELLDAEQWATLALIRAVGKLDARSHLLDRSLLRREHDHD